jgi:glucose/arabinose dehydrogenase
MAMLPKPIGVVTAALVGVAAVTAAGQSALVLTGAAAYGDWRGDAPGIRRKITPADMPSPYATPSANHHPGIAVRPDGASPQAPPGFAVELFAGGLDNPRLIRVAPNGDNFVAESRAGRIRLLRAAGPAGTPEISIFTGGLDRPFGIAFWPPGPSPQYVYVANTGSVVRFPYRSGDLQPAGPAETIVSGLPRGGHWTRDIVFSPDGARMFVSVGSRSNDAERSFGGLWDSEEERADVLVFTPEGRNERAFATGLRNCVGMAVQPATGDLWCSTNERDGLGDDLPPDYVTRVREGGFYGWPWFYIGGNEDPRHLGDQPELRSRVIVPDVLV